LRLPCGGTEKAGQLAPPGLVLCLSANCIAQFQIKNTLIFNLELQYAAGCRV
jgi:hypothetical protein